MAQKKGTKAKSSSLEKKEATAANGAQSGYTKAQLLEFITDIESRVNETTDGQLPSIIALNELLRLPNALELFDEELKGRVRDLWLKLKSTGIEMNDAPLVFGLPKDF